MITYPNVKVNLGLEVLRRRTDGFHDLETVFVPYYGIHDTLEIIPGDGWSTTSAYLQDNYTKGESLSQAITPDGKVMITIARREGVDWDPLKDLTVKAYNLLSEGRELGPVKIFLEKTSPVGAGLGGGSADAAFALRMYSELFSLGLTDDELASYAARLGSDCAFFVRNSPCLGEGRGEILSPVEVKDIDFGKEGCGRYVMKVLTPEGVSVSTADAYRGIVPREVSGTAHEPLLEIIARPVSEWKEALVNDFENTVFSIHPELAAIKKSLYDSGAVYAAMSGSGSALFAIYEK